MTLPDLPAQPGAELEVTCGCYVCLDEQRDQDAGPGGDLFAGVMSRFVVREVCGNKRCPHATWHAHACTGSNDPGQPGSRYQIPRPLDPGETWEQVLEALVEDAVIAETIRERGRSTPVAWEDALGQLGLTEQDIAEAAPSSALVSPSHEPRQGP